MIAVGLLKATTRVKTLVALANNLDIRRTSAYSVIRCYQTTGRVGTAHLGRPSLIDNETRLNYYAAVRQSFPYVTSIKERC